MDTSSDEQLLHWLRAWSASASVEGRLAGGFRNTLWSVRVGGRRYAARLSTRHESALAWEIRLLEYLRAVDMIVPEIVPTRDGRSQIDGLVLFSWLEGEPPSSTSEWRLVANELTRLHELTRDWPQRPTFRSSTELLEEAVGGDVRLDLMPAAVVERVREAWRALQGEPMSVVHGDPGASNIRLHAGRACFVDWDESRVDVSLFDIAALPEGLDLPVEEGLLERARCAAGAWEVANGWIAEPAYARRRLEELDEDTASGDPQDFSPPWISPTLECMNTPSLRRPTNPDGRRPDVYGRLVDDQFRCVHYHSTLDVIAIKHKCCGRFYACVQCHQEEAVHPPRVWPREEFGERAVMCGMCGRQMAINDYMQSSFVCPACHAAFNPHCTSHYHLYFEMS